MVSSRRKVGESIQVTVDHIEKMINSNSKQAGISNEAIYFIGKLRSMSGL